MKKIIFYTDHSVVDIIFNIFKKYNIRESKKDILKKIKNKEELKYIFIKENLEKLFLKEITEEKFLFLLKNKLGINEEIIKNIFKELKEKVLIFAREMKEEKIEKKESLFSNFLEKNKTEDNYKEKIE